MTTYKDISRTNYVPSGTQSSGALSLEVLRRGAEAMGASIGLPIVSDESIPPGTSVIRDKEGKELGRIENIPGAQ